MTKYHISHSQIETYLYCDKKWHFSHIEKLRGREISIPPTTGSCLHEALQGFYKVPQGRRTKDILMKGAGASLDALESMFINKGGGNLWPEDEKKLINIRSLVTRSTIEYWNTYREDQEISASQTEIPAEIEIIPDRGGKVGGSSLDMVIRVDGLIYVNGEPILLEHKSMGEPDITGLELFDTQTPRYMALLQRVGIPVSKVLYNVLPYKAPYYREKYQRVTIQKTQSEIDFAWDELVDIGSEMLKKYEAGTTQPVPRGKFSKFVCKFCQYAPICLTERAGHPTDMIKRSRFEAETVPPLTEEEVAE